MTFNQISSDARDYCRAKTEHARVLFNASNELGESLKENGIDYRDGLLALASCSGGTGESVGNIGFTGHNFSLRRMNRYLNRVNQNYPLRKVGELGGDHGFGFQGRAIYCPTFKSDDRIEYFPGLMWSPDYEQITALSYAWDVVPTAWDAEGNALDGAPNPRCYAEDWKHQLRNIRGLYLLWMMQQNLKGRDTSARYARRLAKTFKRDAEAGVFSYLSDLQKAKAYSIA